MLTRRTVLHLVAAAIPGLVVGCGKDDDPGVFDPESVPESTDRFPRTPIAGDMTDTRVVICFYVDDDAPVTLRMWTNDEVVVDEAVKPSGDGFHKVMIDDLSPGTTYQYAVFSGEPETFEDRSLIGQVRTAPAAGESPVFRMALLSCVGQGTVLPDYYMPPEADVPTEAPFQWELFTHAADKDLDALVHMGDQAYLDFVWKEAGGTVEAYQQAWGYYHGGGYRDLYPLAGLYATWDDHESTDNSAFDPWDISATDAEKLANAQQVWYQVVPIDANKPSDRPVWRNFRWGDTVELILLDCRYELTEENLVSEAQLTWLLDAIRNSPCRFVCVATPRPFADITSDQPLFADNADRWDGNLAQRGRVADLLDELDAGHVIFVTGDIHMNYLGRTSVTGDRPSETAWEVCVTSGNTNPLADSLSDQQFAFVDELPHFPVLTFDPGAGTVHVAFYARDGSVSFEQTLELG